VSSIALSRRAQTDLDEIWEYSAERWGIERADRYVGDLRRAIETLASSPSRGRREVFREIEYVKRTSGSHVIYCRATPHGLRVVRILHQNMDHVRHLP
jgi:toxin ParE1/3/4